MGSWVTIHSGGVMGVTFFKQQGVCEYYLLRPTLLALDMSPAKKLRS